MQTDSDPRFICDGGLGALARWLRAAGFDASWRQDASGDSLVADVRATGGLLLTTDHRVFLRREVREGRVRALHVPSSLTRFEQLAHVLSSLGLSLREPCCIECGGSFDLVDKETVLDRIPPRTARWLDEYYVCRQCGKLFWRGTHWDRIRTRLGLVAGV